jgi:rifampicin phosphotransferase
MTATQWIYFPDDALPHNVRPAALLGGKGLSLRRLSAADVVIPRGFTITTEACRETLARGGDWPEGLIEQLSEAASRLAHETARSIGPGPKALRVAVRSGAECSMPGMLDTILDRPATLTELRAAVSSVFNSWQNESAVAWRKRHGVDESAGTAVTVQEMIEPLFSGVLFTASPESNPGEGWSSSGEMLVEAIAGLGEALVSGQTTPCRFAVRRESLAVRPVEIAATSGAATSGVVDTCLTETRIRDLCETGRRLEKEFGEPLDIEWGLTESGFVFFQSRPIHVAAIPVRADPQIAESQVEAFCKAEIGRVKDRLHRCRVLVRHNLSESLPAPTPMTWSIVRRMMSGSGGFGRLYRMLGYAPGRRVRDEGFLELVAGRIYADPDRMVTLLATEWPMSHDLALLREKPERFNDAPQKFDPDQTHPLLLLLLPHLMWVIVRSSRRVSQLMTDADRRFVEEVIPKWIAWVAQERARDLEAASSEELLAILESRIQTTVDEFAADSLLPGTLGAIALANSDRKLSLYCGGEVAAQFRSSLLRSISSPLQSRQAELLRKLGSGEDVLSEFLTEFGHRGPGEMELSCPRWNEKPPKVAAAASQKVTGPTFQATDHVPADQLRTILTEAGVPQHVDWLVDQLEIAQRLLPYRETGRHNLMAGFALIRGVLEELARRFHLGDGIYFLEADELQKFMRAGQFDELISSRRANREASLRLNVPEYLDEDLVSEITPLRTTIPSSSGLDASRSFEADELAAGFSTGVIVRVDQGDSSRELPPDAILLAEVIDPGLTPLLLQSVGIIVARGGMLSHGAVIARQLGLPAVRSVAAEQALREGQRVIIDTEARTIRLGDDSDD